MRVTRNSSNNNWNVNSNNFAWQLFIHIQCCFASQFFLLLLLFNYNETISNAERTTYGFELQMNTNAQRAIFSLREMWNEHEPDRMRTMQIKTVITRNNRTNIKVKHQSFGFFWANGFAFVHVISLVNSFYGIFPMYALWVSILHYVLHIFFFLSSNCILK